MTLSTFHRLAMLALTLPVFALAGQSAAATRAWIDRDTVALGDTVTLNIETDQATASPDYAPLRAEFELGSPSSSRQVQMVNGATSVKSLFGVALTPRRAGTFAIPPLQVGAQRTTPLSLTVTPGSAAAAPVRGQAPVFIETEVDDANPYVQQNVGMRVRLYYAISLSGQLGVDTPDGLSLQAIGDDVRSSSDVNGNRYSVVERRFLLIPERSGELKLPVARFEGRGMSGEALRISSPPKTLNVRPQPGNAPTPWLPLRDLRLRYANVPSQVRSGEAAIIEIEAVAEGGTRAQFPDLPPPTVPGAQVFPEPVQYDEAFIDGSLRLTMTRRFSVVPDQPGPLTVQGPKMAWWDARNGRAQTAVLDDLSLQVEQGATATAPVPLMDPAGPGRTTEAVPAAPETAPASAATRSIWVWLALAFAMLWLATLAWALWRWRRAPRPVVAGRAAGAVQGAQAAASTMADLKRVLNEGSLDEVLETLKAMATPAITDTDGLIERLADPAQRRAVEGLRRARWHQGDPVAARQALRDVFRDGPQWTATTTVAAEPLPPLYPQR